MPFKQLADVTGRKLRKFVNRIKSSRRTLRSNKIIPEEISSNENNLNKEQYVKWSHCNASFIPSNSIECLAIIPRVPPFPVTTQRTPSFYDNVTCQNNCDSAYFSDGLSDSEHNEVSNTSLKNMSIFQISESSEISFDRWSDSSNIKKEWNSEKEKFENMWNETIESLTVLE